MIAVIKVLIFLWAVTVSLITQAQIPPAYRQVALSKQIPADILYAIAMTESRYSVTTARGKTLIGPWPWSLNINRRGFRFESRAKASQALRKAIHQGDSVDAGIMQINWRWHQHRFENAESLLDPLTNLNTGAEILREQYQQTGDWWIAVGAYHTPASDTASLRRATQYRERVRKQWQSIIKSF